MDNCSSSAVGSVAYQCIGCGKPMQPIASGPFKCPSCGESYVAGDGYLRTEFDEKLFNRYKRDFLLNKALNNNGYISYQFLQDGSISLPDRPQVIRFRQFIESHMKGRRILDIGCGPMSLPGYLALPNKDSLELIGLDPIDDNAFEGARLVAVSEFIPLPDHSVDTVLFATSLDHVCNLHRTLEETLRVLAPGGRVIVWMSDRGAPLVDRVKDWLRRRRNSWRNGYDVDRYYVYPNWTVLQVPRGGVDPFHSQLEIPSKIVKQFKRSGFAVVDQVQHSKIEAFLCFRAAQ